MNVILKKDVDNLGFEFEVVNVKPGYARNYLIPQGLAVLATEKNTEALNKTLEARKAEEAKLIADANEKSSKLEGVTVNLEARVGSGDKLYGSVNNADLAAALQKAGVDIERKNIKIFGNTIKRLGTYTAKIRFHREVETEYTFDVIPDQESLKKAEENAKARAEMARLDAERQKAQEEANKEDAWQFDNPLLTKPKAEEVEEIVEEATEEVASEAKVETPKQEEKA